MFFVRELLILLRDYLISCGRITMCFMTTLTNLLHWRTFYMYNCTYAKSCTPHYPTLDSTFLDMTSELYCENRYNTECLTHHPDVQILDAEMTSPHHLGCDRSIMSVDIPVHLWVTCRILELSTSSHPPDSLRSCF